MAPSLLAVVTSVTCARNV